MAILNVIIGKRSNLTNEISKISKENLIFSNKDLLKKKFTKLNRLKKFNVIFNNSSSMNIDSSKDIEFMVKNNLITTLNFFDVINPKKINKIIYSSSISVKLYEKNLINESRYLYAFLKFTNEKYIFNYCKKNNIKLIICRISNIYGGKENYTFINNLINSYKNNKVFYFNNTNESRDFIHVNDVAKIYMKLIKNNATGYLEIGTGKLIKLKDLVAIFKDKVKVKNVINKNNNNKNNDQLMKLLKINTTLLKKYYNLNSLINLNKYLENILLK